MGYVISISLGFGKCGKVTLDLLNRFSVITHLVKFQAVTKSILMLEVKLLLKMDDLNQEAH